MDYYRKLITFVAEGRNSLIIIDDCASSKSVKNRTSELSDLDFRQGIMDLMLSLLHNN